MTPCPKCQARAAEVRTKRNNEARFRLEGVVCPEHGYVQIAEERTWAPWGEDFR